MRYELMFDALAAGDFDLARNCSENLCLDEDSATLGLGIKALIDGMPTMATECFADCASSQKQFTGMSQFVNAIVASDLVRAQAAVAQMADDHKRRLRRGIFKMRREYHLFIWGIGLLNFARGVYSLDVQGDGPAMPNDLLVPPGSAQEIL